MLAPKGFFRQQSTIVRVAIVASLLFSAVSLHGTHAFQSLSLASRPTQSSVFSPHRDENPPTRLIIRCGHQSSLKSHQVPDDSSSNDITDTERRNGILVLMTVPMAWGTFEPAVRYVYEIQPEVPPFVFSFVYYSIAASALGALTLLPPSNIKEATIENFQEDSTENESDSTGKSTNRLPIQGGFELGTYLFLGNGLQVIGLKTVPSDRAAFLLQLTTIFVPIVQSVLAKNLYAVPFRTWIACLVALAGVAFIGLDGGPGESSLSAELMTLDNIQFSVGDFYIALGAFFYTFHCIRLEVYAKSTSAVKLAAAKASTETLWCIVVVLASVVVASSIPLSTMPLLETIQESGKGIIEYLEMFKMQLSGGALSSAQLAQLGVATAWTGLVTVAYTIYAQSFGQSRVAPATANLIYTTQPFFTALVAYVVLRESLGYAGYIGGFLIAVAVLIVIQSDDQQGN